MAFFIYFFFIYKKIFMDYFSKEDKKYMERAINLAEKGRGKTSPNPMVGTVIVKDGTIISTGYHKMAGLPHAEIEAINNSKKSLEGSVMYVTLEPCTFHGKTPPCTEEIIKHNFKEIVIGCIDPNPLVNGKGVEFLKKSGLKVRTGLLKDRIELQNEVFFKQIKTGVPFVCLKIASTIDGKLATKSSDSKWITSEKSRATVQEIRSEYDCILTGINTVLSDNPYLYPRKKLNEPLKEAGTVIKKKFYRVILDSNLKINLESNIVKTSNYIKTIIFTARNKNNDFSYKIKELQKNNIDVIPVDSSHIPEDGLDILKILKILYREYSITSILLECGPTLSTSFLNRNLIDKFIFFIAPLIIGGDGSYDMFKDLSVRELKECKKLTFKDIKRIDSDIVITAYPLKKQN
jgi:diaminohydroxyphosphoribosylaminopyrimidine deaminase / 5-amino-6-(5-phosphoribosylamino)uracil reductase